MKEKTYTYADRIAPLKRYPFKWAISELNGYAAYETFSGVLHASLGMSLYCAEYIVRIQVRVPGGMWGIPHPVKQCFTRFAAQDYVEENLLAADTALRLLLTRDQSPHDFNSCYLMALLGFAHESKFCRSLPSF